MPASTPSAARSPPVRVRPIVTTASVGMARAGSCVVGSMTRSGRSTTQPVAITSTRRAIAARPGQPASSRSSHVPGLRPVAERLVVDRRAEGDDVEQRAGEREDPHRAQEPHGEDVLRTLRPGHDDQDERPEQDGQAERRQDPSQPRGPVGHVGGVLHGRRAGRPVAATDLGRRDGRCRRGALPVAGVVPSGDVSSGAGVGDESTSKLNEPRAPSSPFGCSVVQLTLQEPAGIGTRIGTVSVWPSALLTVGPTFGGPNGFSRHVMVTVESPTGASSWMTTCVGGVASSAPSSGDVLSRFADCAPTGPPPTRSAPRNAASAATRNRDRLPGTPVRVGTTATR